MDWGTVKDIKNSLERLNGTEATDESKVTMLLNGKEVFLLSIGIDGNNNVVIQLDQDE